MKKSGFIISLLIMICILYHDTLILEAADNEQIQTDIIDEFDFSKLNRCINRLLPDTSYSFESLFQDIMNGNFSNFKEKLIQILDHQLFYEFKYQKKTFIQIVLIAIFAALFSNFSNAFQNKQISEICFYIIYLLLFALCLNSFHLSVQIVEDEMNKLIEFMEILCPTYLLSVAIAVGANTSIIFYNVVLLIIYLVEVIIFSIIMPAIHIYIMVQMMNFLNEEEIFSEFIELIEKIITWVLKSFLTIMIGIGIVQRLLSPTIDNLKRSVLTKGAESLPVVGDALNGSVEVFLGTAVVVKNSIGITGIVICMILIIVPMIKIVFMVFVFKIASSVIQPISDKRITGCLSGVSKGGELLLRVLYTVSLLFMITIALIASTTHA